MPDPHPTVVPFPQAPRTSPAAYADVVVGAQRLRIVPDDTGQEGFRAYAIRRNERLGVEEAVEVPLPGRGDLLEALTGLTRAWRQRVDEHVEIEP
jgi:hypothetical protein